uniref:Uncharacterized protein n=1 Tax=Cacopsylla melanoneura TaxID=428564 RepID=A0A8D8Y9N6_9HEMI
MIFPNDLQTSLVYFPSVYTVFYLRIDGFSYSNNFYAFRMIFEFLFEVVCSPLLMRGRLGLVYRVFLVVYSTLLMSEWLELYPYWHCCSQEVCGNLFWNGIYSSHLPWFL